jgi:prepilin-type N-terminal cleavage/methylation domain-containing protein
MIRRTRSQAGFTLIELIIFIVISGALSLFALPRFDRAGPKVAAVAEKLVQDLRYAQSRAVTTQIRHGIVMTGTQYEIFEFDNGGNPTAQQTKDPAGDQLVTVMTGLYDGVALSTLFPNGGMYFDATGTPFASPAVALTTATNTINIQAGAICEQLTISIMTGLISNAVYQGGCP